MSNLSTPDVNDQAAEWARPLYAQHIAFLSELAEMGMEAARAVSGQIKAGDADPQPLAMAYGRVARAVRMTLLLQARFIKELQAYDRNAGYLTTVAATNRKAQVTRIVERIAEAEADDQDHAERLVKEMGDCIDQDDIYGLVLSRPVSELVAMICKDLGLSPDWPRLAEEAWAREEIGSGSVGAPLAGTAFSIPALAGEEARLTNPRSRPPSPPPASPRSRREPCST